MSSIFTTAPGGGAKEAGKPAADKAKRKDAFRARIERASRYLSIVGLGWIAPILRMASGEDKRTQLKDLWQQLGVPVLAIVLFLGAWAAVAPTVKTSLGTIPGPGQVWAQAVALYDDHLAERKKADAFYERQEKRNARRLARDPNA